MDRGSYGTLIDCIRTANSLAIDVAIVLFYPDGLVMSPSTPLKDWVRYVKMESDRPMLNLLYRVAGPPPPAAKKRPAGPEAPAKRIKPEEDKKRSEEKRIKEERDHKSEVQLRPHLATFCIPLFSC